MNLTNPFEISQLARIACEVAPRLDLRQKMELARKGDPWPIRKNARIACKVAPRLDLRQFLANWPI
jgi:hypothetical protein